MPATQIPILTSGQIEFANTLSALSGLDRIVIEAWCLAEESGDAARSRQNSGNHNWLNIGYFDSGPSGKITRDKVFGNPIDAARASNAFLRGKNYKTFTAKADPTIRAIIRTAGQTPNNQMDAICRSNWASSHYNNCQSLKGAYKTVGHGVANPNVPSNNPDFIYKGSGTAKTKSSGCGALDVGCQLGRIADLFDAITSGAFWLRVLQVIGGLAMMAGGVVLIAKAEIGGIAGDVVSGALKGAK